MRGRVFHALPRAIAATVFSLPLFIAAPAHADPFYTGGDVSLIPFLESRGAVYKDVNGAVKLPEKIMADHGANLFRIRLFVNPSSNYDDAANHGDIQDLTYDIALAKRIQAVGGKVMLDLHYSDVWADPARTNHPCRLGEPQFRPAQNPGA